MKLKNFNWIIFLSTFFVTALLIIPSLLAAFAEREGALKPEHTIWNFFARFSYVLRFPTHTLFPALIIAGGPITFFGGLFANCMFYALFIERFAYFLIEIKKKNVRGPGQM